MQKTLEDYVLRLAGDAENVCLGGGVAWNALLVSALETSGRFKGVFAQPAAGNAGTALGAALSVWNELLGETRRIDGGGYCLGPSFSAPEIKQVLENCKLRFRLLATTPEMIGAAVDQLKENRIVAWMQGRMEFGPRALGNRSILASPQDPYSTENLNAFIKHREAVRKFAASVPAELASEYFEAGPNARHLATVEPRSRAVQRAIPRGDSGQRSGARAHGFEGRQSALLAVAARLRRKDRPAGSLQHVVQSVRRTAGLHAARRGAQLLFLGHRRHGRGQLPACEIIRLCEAANRGRSRLSGGQSSRSSLWFCEAVPEWFDEWHDRQRLSTDRPEL